MRGATSRDLRMPMARRWVPLHVWMLAAWWWVGFCLPHCHGQADMEEPLNPHCYLSPSGHCALSVDPVERFGQGAADCRLERDGTTAWSARLPFTLREAAIGEDGTAVGYSYSSGLQGGRGLDGDKGRGSLRLLILDPQDGHLRLREKIEREWSMAMHAPPVPVVDGVLLDEAGGRFIARLSGGKAGEIWRVYRLADGHPVDRITLAKVLPPPGANAVNFVAAARMVPGTPLALCQWKSYGRADPDRHFLLFDFDRRAVVWSTDFPAEQPPKPTQTEVASAADAPVDPLSKRVDGAILQTGPADASGSRFALWSAARRERVDYRIARGADGQRTTWQVAEERRTPLDVPPPDPAEPQTSPLLSLPTTPDAPLKPLNVFRFPADAAPVRAIRSIRNFAFDGRGNIGLLRVEGGRAALVLVDPGEHGAVRREIDLPTPDLSFATTRLACLENDRWLVVAFNNMTEADWARSSAWLVDAGAGTAAPFPGWEVPSVKGVAAAGDGNFVVLEEHTVNYSDHTLSMPTSLIGLDRTGRRRWTLDESNDAMFSPQDVAVLSDGKTAAVVETIRDDVVLCDLADGKVLKTIHLKKAWGREPTYPAEITADQDGGFLVGDWQNKVPYVRCRADGRIRAVVTPRYADGHQVNGHGIPMRVDPSGHPWMSDRDSLLRLDAHGRVDFVLGEAREEARLGAVGKIAVGDDGRLYAVSARTGDVHVLDENGREQAVCHPQRQDVPDRADAFNVAVDPARHVFLGAGEYGLARNFDQEPPPQVEFGPDGTRLGTRQMHLGKTCQSWRFSPDGKRLLVSGYDDARVIDAATTRPIRHVTRQSDRRWLDDVSPGIACAPDGAFALASALPGETTDWALDLYDAAGTPSRRVRLPPETTSAFVAYDGQRIVSAQKGTNRLVVFGVNAGVPGRAYRVELPPGNALDTAWQPYLVHGGRQLWLVCAETKTVACFAWPP